MNTSNYFQHPVKITAQAIINQSKEWRKKKSCKVCFKEIIYLFFYFKTAFICGQSVCLWHIQYACRGQRTTFISHFALSTTWVTKIEIKSTSTFTNWIISLAQQRRVEDKPLFIYPTKTKTLGQRIFQNPILNF